MLQYQLVLLTAHLLHLGFHLFWLKYLKIHETCIWSSGTSLSQPLQSRIYGMVLVLISMTILGPTSVSHKISVPVLDSFLLTFAESPSLRLDFTYCIAVVLLLDVLMVENSGTSSISSLLISSFSSACSIRFFFSSWCYTWPHIFSNSSFLNIIPGSIKYFCIMFKSASILVDYDLDWYLIYMASSDVFLKVQILQWFFYWWSMRYIQLNEIHIVLVRIPNSIKSWVANYVFFPFLLLFYVSQVMLKLKNMKRSWHFRAFWWSRIRVKCILGAKCC